MHSVNLVAIVVSNWHRVLGWATRQKQLPHAGEATILPTPPNHRTCPAIPRVPIANNGHKASTWGPYHKSQAKDATNLQDMRAHHIACGREGAGLECIQILLCQQRAFVHIGRVDALTTFQLNYRYGANKLLLIIRHPLKFDHSLVQPRLSPKQPYAVTTQPVQGHEHFTTCHMTVVKLAMPNSQYIQVGLASARQFLPPK
mmetsp:Transcript_59914/g.111008  ORF Transcript_59914/g.111008 Transcript_59914/m.111008 type:complete len:201 (+) Transcript_59914:1961-2563(+)